MNWLTGGGDAGGGWEDDDELGDFSDQSLEEEEESGNEQQHQAASSSSSPPQQSGAVALGGGMFMGRLTRFLEAVTQPSSGEEEENEEFDDAGGEGEGWGDELDLDDEDIQMDDDPPPQDTPAAQPFAASALIPPDELVNSGWDDDLDLTFDPQPTEEQPGPEETTYLTMPLNDVNTEEEPIRNVSFGDLPDQSSSPGWEENDGLDEVMMEDDHHQHHQVVMDEETMPPPAPSRQISSLSSAAKTEVAVANSASSGWDKEDQDLDGLDDDDVDMGTETAAPAPQLVDHTPLPPPPPQAPGTTTSRVTTSSTLQTQSVSFAGASAIAVASASDIDDGWDDEDAIVLDQVDDVAVTPDESSHLAPTKILDHTPPPPPPPTSNDAASHAVSFAAMSTGAVAASTETGWDEDDGTLDELDVDGNADEEENNQMVDVTPPPPLPRRDSKATASAIAVTDENDGWDDDDDDDLDIDDDKEEAEVDSTPLVDHTPPPPPPPRSNPVIRDTMTDVAVMEADGEDDDISRDDTLSIANSRARYEEQQYQQLANQSNGPPLVDKVPLSLGNPISFKRTETSDAVRSGNSIGSSTIDDARPSGDTFASGSVDRSTPPPIVDHTPPVNPTLDRHASTEESMLVLGGGGNGNSSITESWDSLSDRVSEVRPRNRRMVDKTPMGRFHRGMPIDTSMAVAGQTSVGESLDSIDEVGEEPDSPARDTTSTPAIDAARWQPGEEYTINIDTATRSGITGLPGTIAEDDDDGMPLVDHTPLPLVKNNSTAASVDVLSVSSEEGDLGESMVGIDDVKEDLYGQVVDHTPATPNPSQRPKVGSAGLGDVAGVKQEDDTVVGVAENTDVEKDIRADDDMDDESSRGTKTTLEEYENRSLIGTVRLTIPEDEQLVDHVPPDRKMASADASTVVFADASTASSQVGDDIVNDDDDTSPAGFGPIVDHLPSVHIRSARSVATSIVTQTSGLDVDIKEDEDFDNTVGPGTSTVGGDEGSENEENSLPPMVSEEKHLVDHVPKRASRNPPIDGSMRVMVDQADDDMTQGVDTIAEDAAVDFGPIVDHTPFTARSGALTVGVSMTTLPPNPEDEADNTTNVGVSTDVDDGWDNEIPELEDISAGEGGPTMEETKEPAVVDHVPRRSFSHPADASTMVVVDPNDETSAVDYDDTAANNGAESNSRLFGPVVDHTPTPPISGTQRSVDASMQVMASTRNDDADDIEDGGTWFGASTVGGVSTVGASGEASTAGDDSSRGGWDDDGDVLDDLASPTTPARRFESNGSHLVDHVPQITLTGPTDVSIAVAVDPSVASSHEKEEEQDNIDVGPFGAVVDHTPSVARRESHLSVANSVATLATGITNDIKRDEEMDETTWNGGVSTQGDGWDQEEPELQALADAEEDQMPTLVDHVPERPESRPTDASTFVAGDASEIFSQVDDLGQDETYFGPVVDQTPHSQFSVHASAAGSTMVNVASVAEDDLDVAVEKAIDGEDPRTEAEEQTGWQETLPNPQSGNDDMSEDREQLVDYVPDEQEEEIPDIVHDGSSEMATVGEKSAALPADDPKEDEFGPVVDHLPILDELSHSPTISVTESNGDGRKKPSSTSPSSGPKNIDSVAANFSVESKESKDDGLEEDEFGPVVDHLPTSSSRASFTPSRGGSTVDALATVSEVEDDYVAGEGWEEDVDIDVSDQASPINSARPGDDRNLSVKWVDGLSGNNTTANSGGTSDSHFFDAEMGDSSRLPLNETRYYDPELGNVNAWGSLNLDADEDGDDTPPSTPRNSFESRQVLDIGESKQSALIANGAGNECRLCANSSTADCPCVKRLLAANEGKEGMIGSLKTPEGNTLKVNFDKLLETEMTKRRLVEKEFQALRATIESLKSSKDSLVLAGETQMDVLNKMKNSNSTLANDLEATKAETNELRAENRDFHAKNKTLGDQLAALEEEKRNLETECLSLKRDMEILQAKLTQVSSSASSDLSSRESELQSEISKWKGSNEELLHKIARFETECENLRGKNESLYEDLDSYRECVSKLEETNAAILSRESSLSVEMKHLKGSLQSQQQASVGSFQAQINSLQSEIAAKSGECAELKSQVASLQKKLTVSEADKFKHTKELARITKDRDATISEFEKRISKTKEEMENTLRTKDAAIAELKAKLSTESQMIQKLREEKAALENVKRTDAMVHQGAIAEKNRQISTIHNELKTTAAKIETLEKEKQRLSSSIEELRKQLAAEEAKSRQLLPISKERDSLKEALQQKNWAVAQMEAQIAQYDQKIEQSSSHWQQEVTMLQQERDRLVLELSSSSKEFEEVTQTLKKVQSEKEHFHLMVNELESKCSTLEETNKQATPSEGTMIMELQDLKNQLDAAHSRNDMLLAEQSEHSKMHAELENKLNQVLASLEMAESERARLESNLEQSDQHVHILTSEMNAVKADRQRLHFECEELRSNATRAILDAQDSQSAISGSQKTLDDLAGECKTLREELYQARGSCDQRETRIRALESEIEKSKGLAANKDKSMAMLTAQQKSSQAAVVELQSMNKSLTLQVTNLESKVQGFDQERLGLKQLAEQHTANMEKINAELEAVSQQRDTLLEERNMLEGENEEMLIQFGLLKEEMDSTDEQIEQLHADRAAWEKAAQDSQRELEEMQCRLDELTKNLKGEAHEALAATEAAKERLAREKRVLQAEAQALNEKNSILEGQLRAFESEKADLLYQIEDLRRDVTESTISSQAKESRLTSIISDMEVKNQELTDKTHAQERSLFELQASLDQSSVLANEALDLRHRLGVLEQSLADNERLLHQKDGALEDLRYQIEHSGKAPVESAELETLRRTVREMEESAERDRSNIQELEELSDETTRELKKTMGQLSSAERLVSQLRNEVDAKRQTGAEMVELKERLVEAEQRLAQANQDVSSFRSESTELRRHLALLDEELKDFRRVSDQPTKEPSGQSSAEMQSLRQQIEMLKQQQIASSSETGAREEVIEREVHVLQQQMRQKDSEINKLESEVQLLGSDLSNKHKELENKKQHVEELSSELEGLRSQAHQSSTSRVLELTRDEAESVDKMRSQIISLAKALEQSEGRRAVAIERLEHERQANADSLRRLTDSVKRFYSTLSLGDN